MSYKTRVLQPLQTFLLFLSVVTAFLLVIPSGPASADQLVSAGTQTASTTIPFEGQLAAASVATAQPVDLTVPKTSVVTQLRTLDRRHDRLVAAAQAAKARKALEALKTAKTYTIVHDDALSEIAEKTDTEVPHLMCLNPNKISDPDEIIAGDTIRLRGTCKQPEPDAPQPATVSSATSGAPAPSSTSVSSGRIATVIAYAKAHLGDPYVWGAAGPNSFDCSGLTMMAFKQIGINLPHFSRGQYAFGHSVNSSDIRAGDLVFYGSSAGSIHHVALAISNTDKIEAPHSNSQVRITPIHYGDYFGAKRIIDAPVTSVATTSNTNWQNMSHLQQFVAAGGASSQFYWANQVFNFESGWNPHADNPSSSAYGIPQALPGSKMASAGADWRDNPITQIRWAIGYINSRYHGSWHEARIHQINHGWY